MSEAMRAELAASLGWKWTGGSVTDDGRLAVQAALAQDAPSDSALAVWCQEHAALAAATPRLLDLTALERPLWGDFLLVDLAAVKALVIVHHGTTGTLRVGAAGDQEWSAPFAASGQAVDVPPQSALVLSNWQDGWPVNGSHCKLRIAARDDDVDYSIAILGVRS